MAKEKDDQLDCTTSRYEERLVELHSVIAELSRQLEEKNREQINEEETDDEEEEAKENKDEDKSDRSMVIKKKEVTTPEPNDNYENLEADRTDGYVKSKEEKCIVNFCVP